MDQAEPTIKNVLVVEDDINLGGLIVPLLTNERLAVNLVTDGEATLALMGLRYYDFVYLDIMLPYMNGFDVLKNVRKRKIKVGPIVVFSGLLPEVAKSKAMALGATEYVCKKDITAHQLADVAEKVAAYLYGKTDA